MKQTLLAQSLNFRQEAAVQDVPYAESTVGAALMNLMTAILAFGVLVVFFFIVMAAFDWITSGGEKGKVESARNKITGAIVGLVILASVFAIIMILQRFLGIRVFNFGGSAANSTSGQPFIPVGGNTGRVIN